MKPVILHDYFGNATLTIHTNIGSSYSKSLNNLASLSAEAKPKVYYKNLNIFC